MASVCIVLISREVQSPERVRPLSVGTEVISLASTGEALVHIMEEWQNGLRHWLGVVGAREVLRLVRRLK
jgi:hypothetical protein